MSRPKIFPFHLTLLKKNRVNKSSLYLWSEELSLVEEWISLDSNSSRVKIHYSASEISSVSPDIHSKRSDHWRHYTQGVRQSSISSFRLWWRSPASFIFSQFNLLYSFQNQVVITNDQYRPIVLLCNHAIELLWKDVLYNIHTVHLYKIYIYFEKCRNKIRQNQIIIKWTEWHFFRE